MSKSKILFQMTGSIACFKACQVISKLIQAGYDVQVVASASALQFVGNATIEGLTGKPVISDLYASGNVMDHIHLVRWADLIVVAPASANFINKVARGVGDDLLTTMFLAHDFKKPYLIAPAMNTSMYSHPVTQSSIQILKKMGIEILETASGVLACGEIGWGRLLEPDLLLQEIQSRLSEKASSSFVIPQNLSPKAGLKVLVTSGGTQEPLDSVRVITNKSTGATGAALTEILTSFGFDVTYLHGESAKLPLVDCQKVAFASFQDLQRHLENLLSNSEYKAVIHLAAVSDYSPTDVKEDKISSESDEIVLKLKRNPKLVDQFRSLSKNAKLQVIAFKLTANANLDQRKSAVNKLFAHSHANLVVQNDTSEMAQEHLFYVFSSQGSQQELRGKHELGFYLGEYLAKELL